MRHKPSIIPTSVFAARSPFSHDPQLSPDGRLLAYSVEAADKTAIRAIDIDSAKTIHNIELGKGQVLRWYRWAGNDRLLLSVVVPIDNSWEKGRVSRLFVIDVQTGHAHYVGPRRQWVEGDDVLYTDPQGKFLLMEAEPGEGREPQVWRFALDGGDAKGEKIESKDGVWHWIADEQGVVRIGIGVESGRIKIWYRKNAGEKLRSVAKFDKDDDEDKVWDVIRLMPGSDEGLVLKPGPSGHVALRKFNYATREVGEVIYENPNWDLNDFSIDHNGKPTAVSFTDDRDETVWLDPAMAKLQNELRKALGGKPVRIVQLADNKSRMLIEEADANDPGAWYVYTPATRELTPVSPVRPDLDPALLAPVKPIEYTARDGTKIRAYLTLPPGREAKGLPLIIMPHGGPYDVRDKLQYDPEVQLLANRGYAVLQPNYRGSGGFGEAFEDLGKGQIGRGMQDDLDDAMDWAVEQGIADAKRVCLDGASYGGYAALWGVIRNPERYRCAASYAGVTDWGKQLWYDNDFFSRSERHAWHERIRGTDRSFDMDSVSPQKQVKRLKRPVLLGQGRKDHTVPYSQFEDMREALQKASTPGVQYLVLQNSAHGFADAKEEQAWFDALVGFLKKNNPAD